MPDDSGDIMLSRWNQAHLLVSTMPISPDEEYRQKWEYLRHLETKRDHMIQLYVAIVGALGWLIAKDATTLAVFWMRVGDGYMLPLLVYLLFHSVFLQMFLVADKKNYVKYHDRLIELEGGKLSPGKHLVFLLYYSLPALIGTAIFGIFLFACSVSIGWAITAAACYAIFSYVAAKYVLVWML